VHCLQKIVKERDEERERLRKELRRSRERLHVIDAEAQRRETLEIPSAPPELIAQNESSKSLSIIIVTFSHLSYT
jgi:hypothetical protein